MNAESNLHHNFQRKAATRLFIQDVKQKHFELVRIMGVVTSITGESFILDDGTETIEITHSKNSNIKFTSMYQYGKQSMPTVGQTVDCVGVVSIQENQHPILLLHRHTLVTDTNEFSLRTLEILRKPKCENEDGTTMLGSIAYHFGSFYVNERLCLRKSHVLQLIQSSKEDGGVNENDLALVLNCTDQMNLVFNALQELQADGEIYRGNNGEYLPL